MKIMRNSLVIWYCFITVILNGCSGVKFSEWRFPYMYPVQQGNYITEQQLSQLKVGMTKDQVSFVVGHPVTQFMFNSQQWQYMFQQFRNDKLRNSYIVNINFESDIMKSVESSGQVFIK
jgi:outer membrane protein assembly factor BamE